MHFSAPTPELAVPDVPTAQHYYRDHLGFAVMWHNKAGKIGAIARDHCVIFLREAPTPQPAGTFWIFVAEVDAAHQHLQKLGAKIVDPISDKPWGLRQFTVADPYGNQFHFHCDP